jgi:transposase-like protein
MRMTTNFSRAVDLRELPLCSTYLSVQIEALLVHVREPGSTQELSVHWGLGTLADGQLDILGVWLELGAGEMLWDTVFGDLQVRGVETMRFVSGIDPAVIGAGLFASYPRTVALTSIGRFVRRIEADLIETDRVAADCVLSALRAAGTVQEARSVLADLAASPIGGKYPSAVARWEAALEQLALFYALTPRLRRLIRRAEDAAHHLDQRLRQALDGRICFNDGEAAVSFVAETLIRAESDLGPLAASPGKGIGRRVSKRPARPSTAVAGH